MSTIRTQFGMRCEEAVCELLMSQGYVIRDRNWRRPWGEIDIVATLDGIVHFVEVKASTIHTTGFEPHLRANATKMRKVERTARSWLAYHSCSPETEWQLDVASVIMEGNRPSIELYRYV